MNINNKSKPMALAGLRERNIFTFIALCALAWMLVGLTLMVAFDNISGLSEPLPYVAAVGTASDS